MFPFTLMLLPVLFNLSKVVTRDEGFELYFYSAVWILVSILTLIWWLGADRRLEKLLEKCETCGLRFSNEELRAIWAIGMLRRHNVKVRSGLVKILMGSIEAGREPTAVELEGFLSSWSDRAWNSKQVDDEMTEFVRHLLGHYLGVSEKVRRDCELELDWIRQRVGGEWI